MEINSTCPNLNGTRSWTDEPCGRGSMGIIISCASTIIISAYTAIHLGLPEPGMSLSACFRWKLNWAIAWALAPDLVVFVATTELEGVRRFTTLINGRALKDAQDENSTKHTSGTGTWTNTHSYFTDMKGFSVDLLRLGFRWSKCFGGHSTARLTLEGVRFLHDIGVDINVRYDDIMDKAKSNFLAKAISCSQLFWLLIQLYGRFKEGLTRSVLELHTMGNVFTALACYAIWWDKPFDVSEPIDVSNQVPPRLIAYMISYQHRNPKLGEESDHMIDDFMEEGGAVPLSILLDAEERYPVLKQQTKPDGPDFHLLVANRWNSNTSCSIEFTDPDPGLCKRQLRYALKISIVLIILLNVANFGNWTNIFPTKTELWTWRISAILYAATLPLAYVYTLVSKRCTKAPPAAILALGNTLLGPTVIILLLCSRLYLFIEGFVALRKAPGDTYSTPDWKQWTQSIPHI